MMTGADLTALGVAVVLVAVAALATAADVALTRMTGPRVQALVDDGRPGAARLATLVDRPERWRSSLLLVAVASVMVAAVVVGVVASGLWGTVGVVVGLGVAVVVVFVMAAALPRLWASRHPERVALAASLPVSVLSAFVPLRLVGRGLTTVATVMVPGGASPQEEWVSEQELLAVAAAAVAGDVIEQGERDLIASIIDFGDTVVREVMVPRPDMVTVPASLRVPDAMEVAILHGYSRLPATDGDIDDVVGLVYAKDLMRAERDGDGGGEVAGVLRAAHFVPETKRIAELLREMQAEQFHMAIAVDEYGGTAGLVTLEDIIEELVGEIVDEYDREEPMVEPVAGGRVRVNARIAIDELNDVLGSELAGGDWDTAAGLLFHLLGRVPQTGDWAASDGWILTADRVQGRRISRIVVQPASCELSWSADPVDNAGVDNARPAGGGTTAGSHR
jgi:CBS domain containing-hemolysin-like protein